MLDRRHWSHSAARWYWSESMPLVIQWIGQVQSVPTKSLGAESDSRVKVLDLQKSINEDLGSRVA